MSTSRAILVAAIAGSLVALVPFANAQQPGAGPVATACKAEIDKHCTGKPHGGRAVRTCLEAKKAELSEACTSALNATDPGKGQNKGMMGKGGMGQGMGKGMCKQGMDCPMMNKQ